MVGPGNTSDTDHKIFLFLRAYRLCFSSFVLRARLRNRIWPTVLKVTGQIRVHFHNRLSRNYDFLRSASLHSKNLHFLRTLVPMSHECSEYLFNPVLEPGGSRFSLLEPPGPWPGFKFLGLSLDRSHSIG